MADQIVFEATDSLGPRATGRERFAAATLWLPVVAVSVTASLWFDQLPSVLPKQWAGSGVTSTVATEVMIGVTGGIALLGALVGLAALANAAADIRRTLVLAAGFAAGLSAGIWFVTAGLVLATGSPEPDAGGWPLLGVLACAYGLIPFALSPRRQPGLELASPTTVPLGASETGAWFTTVRVPIFAWLSVIAAVAAAGVTTFSIIEGGPGASAAATALVLVVGICLTFARLQVSVDRRGLRIVSSLLRLPIKQIQLDHIDSARAETIRPLEWGGWGYRILPGRSALVLVGGPGIVVQRRNGTLFAVTVPDPELPAALLTTLAAR